MQYFGKLFLARTSKALGLEDKSLTSCPPLERFLLTISSIWCHLWKSTQARPTPFSAQFSALESSVDTPAAWAGEHVLAPPFFILNSETFPDILFADKQLCWSKRLSIYFFEKGVLLYQNEWNSKNMGSKLSPFFTLSSPLGNKRPNLPSVQLPPAWMTGSDKVSQDFSVGISQRTLEFTPSQRQSFHSPAGTRLARFKHDLAQVMGS